MNYALLTAGLPWVTIRSDERMPFFKSIERAQVDDEAGPFIEFVWHLIRQAVRELKPSPERRPRAIPKPRPGVRRHRVRRA